MDIKYPCDDEHGCYIPQNTTLFPATLIWDSARARMPEYLQLDYDRVADRFTYYTCDNAWAPWPLMRAANVDE